MRVSLKADNSEFEKQVRVLRRYLNEQAEKGGTPAASSRLMQPCFLPFLTSLRTEIKNDTFPDDILTGAADLIANVAVTVVESLFDEATPTEQLGAAIEAVIRRGYRSAIETFLRNETMKATPAKPN